MEGVIVPLSRVGGDSAYGIKLSHAPGTGVDLLIDSVRLTDGTGLNPIAIPPAVHNQVPANWGPDFLLGSFDNRELGKSILPVDAHHRPQDRLAHLRLAGLGRQYVQ